MTIDRTPVAAAPNSTEKLTKQRRLVQFFKSRMCPWFESGKCFRGEFCNYAHNDDELRPRPDLSKTKLCPDLATCDRIGCLFAHNESELRVTAAYYKISLCKKFQRKGWCPYGDNCRYAHGEKELRSCMITPSRSTLPANQHIGFPCTFVEDCSPHVPQRHILHPQQPRSGTTQSTSCPWDTFSSYSAAATPRGNVHHLMGYRGMHSKEEVNSCIEPLKVGQHKHLNHPNVWSRELSVSTTVSGSPINPCCGTMYHSAAASLSLPTSSCYGSAAQQHETCSPFWTHLRDAQAEHSNAMCLHAPPQSAGNEDASIPQLRRDQQEAKDRSGQYAECSSAGSEAFSCTYDATHMPRVMAVGANDFTVCTPGTAPAQYSYDEIMEQTDFFPAMSVDPLSNPGCSPIEHSALMQRQYRQLATYQLQRMCEGVSLQELMAAQPAQYLD